MSELLGGLLRGFVEGRERKLDREQKDKLRKAQVKLYEAQLEQQQNQQGARQQLLDMITGAPEPLPEGQMGPPEPREARSLVDLLSDPEGQALMMQADPNFLGSQIQSASKRQNMQQTLQMLGFGEGIAGGSGLGATGTPDFEVSGIKLGPDGQIMPDFGRPAVVTKEIDTPQGPRIATLNQRTGEQVADLGAPGREMSSQDAGRVAALAQGKDIGKALEKQLFRDGKLDRKLVFTMWSGLPGTEGRNLRFQLSDAVDAVLRARTGAAATNEEQQRIMSELMPSPLDNDATARNKLQRLQKFLGGALDVIQLPPSVKQRLGAGGGGQVIDFSELPDG